MYINNYIAAYERISEILLIASDIALRLVRRSLFTSFFLSPKSSLFFWGPLYLRALGSCRNIKKTSHNRLVFLVGVTGLEPAASWSRTKRATKLRYTPLFLAYIFYILFLFFASVSAMFYDICVKLYFYILCQYFFAFAMI